MVSEQVTELSELGVEGVLDAVETWHAERTQRDVAIFVAAAHFADLHHPDARADSGRVLPGSERGIRLGGAGTPKVREFAPAEFAARIGKSPYAGRALVADALDTQHRLPRLWARVRAGQVPVFYARHVAQQTRELSVEAAGLVDAAVVGYADGGLGWSRFDTLVAAKVVEADPAAAAERERQAATEEFAKVGRSNTHGQKTLYVKSSAAAIIRVFASIDFLAQALAALGDTDDADHRQAKALLVMANPLQAIQLLQAFATHRAGQNNPADHNGQGSQATFDDRGDLGNLDDQDTNDNLDSDSDGEDGDSDEPHKDPVAAFLKPFRPYEIGPDPVHPRVQPQKAAAHRHAVPAPVRPRRHRPGRAGGTVGGRGPDQRRLCA